MVFMSFKRVSRIAIHSSCMPVRQTWRCSIQNCSHALSIRFWTISGSFLLYLWLTMPIFHFPAYRTILSTTRCPSSTMTLFIILHFIMVWILFCKTYSPSVDYKVGNEKRLGRVGRILIGEILDYSLIQKDFISLYTCQRFVFHLDSHSF